MKNMSLLGYHVGRADTWEPKYNIKRQKYSSEDKKCNRQKTKYEGPRLTVLYSSIYYDPAEEYNADQIPCRIMIMIPPLA